MDLIICAIVLMTLYYKIKSVLNHRNKNREQLITCNRVGVTKMEDIPIEYNQLNL